MEGLHNLCLQRLILCLIPFFGNEAEYMLQEQQEFQR